jgi:hypothetical protein
MFPTQISEVVVTNLATLEVPSRLNMAMEVLSYPGEVFRQLHLWQHHPALPELTHLKSSALWGKICTLCKVKE